MLVSRFDDRPRRASVPSTRTRRRLHFARYVQEDVLHPLRARRTNVRSRSAGGRNASFRPLEIRAVATQPEPRSKLPRVRHLRHVRRGSTRQGRTRRTQWRRALAPGLSATRSQRRPPACLPDTRLRRCRSQKARRLLGATPRLRLNAASVVAARLAIP